MIRYAELTPRGRTVVAWLTTLALFGILGFVGFIERI